MNLKIRYKLKNENYVEDKSFELEFNEGVSKEAVIEALSQIQRDHAGDYSDKYYFAEEAAGVCCEFDGKEEFRSGFGTDKLEPLVFIDGLIRRFNVSELAISDGNEKQILRNPVACEVAGEESKDDFEKEIKEKCIESGIESCIKADKYIKTAEYEYDKDDKYEFEIDEPWVLFSFQDPKEGRITDKAYYPGCVPYFFLLKGVRGEWNTTKTDSDLRSGEEVNYDFRAYREIIINDKVIPLICAVIEYRKRFWLHEESRRTEGAFFASLMGKDLFDSMIQDYKILFILGLMPVLAVGGPDADDKRDTVVFSDLDKWINKEGDVELHILDRGFKEDICKQLDNSLKEYGLNIWSDYEYLVKKDMIDEQEKYKELTPEQTRKIFGFFNERYQNVDYDNDSIKKDMEYGMSELGLTEGAVGTLDDDRLIKMLIDTINNKEIECEDARTEVEVDGKKVNNLAIHELGHAVVYKERGIMFEKVSIVSTDSYDGIVQTENPDDIICENRICFSLGSRVAEAMIFGASSKTWKLDYKDAGTDIIELILQNGEFEYDKSKKCVMCRFPEDERPYRFGSVVDDLFHKYMRETEKLLSDKEDLIRYLAVQLMEEKEMDRKRFDELYDEYYSRNPK